MGTHCLQRLVLRIHYTAAAQDQPAIPEIQVVLRAARQTLWALSQSLLAQPHSSRRIGGDSLSLPGSIPAQATGCRPNNFGSSALYSAVTASQVFVRDMFWENAEVVRQLRILQTHRHPHSSLSRGYNYEPRTCAYPWLKSSGFERGAIFQTYG